MGSKETKEKIIEALEGIKEYNVSYKEEVEYFKTFKAKSEKELREKFNNGELEFNHTDIIDGSYVEDSLEIDEVEK